MCTAIDDAPLLLLLKSQTRPCRSSPGPCPGGVSSFSCTKLLDACGPSLGREGRCQGEAPGGETSRGRGSAAGGRAHTSLRTTRTWTALLPSCTAPPAAARPPQELLQRDGGLQQPKSACGGFIAGRAAYIPGKHSFVVKAPAPGTLCWCGDLRPPGQEKEPLPPAAPRGLGCSRCRGSAGG